MLLRKEYGHVNAMGSYIKDSVQYADKYRNIWGPMIYNTHLIYVWQGDNYGYAFTYDKNGVLKERNYFLRDDRYLPQEYGLSIFKYKNKRFY